MVITGIYKITNVDNGKMYIGQSNDVIDRIRHHKSSLRNNRHENNYLQNSWNLHGENSFKFELIEECEESELNEKEIYWIAKLNTYVKSENSMGYNLTIGGEGTRGIHKVLQFDLMGNFIAEWQNGIVASQKTGINVGTIYGCCVQRLKRADKYIFVYKENYNSIEDLSWYFDTKKYKPIEQYDLDGNLLKIWNGWFSIQNELGFRPLECLRHEYLSYNGYIFKYADDPIVIDKDYCNKAKENLKRLSNKIVYQYDLDGNFIQKYNSLRETEKYGYSYRMVARCLKNPDIVYKNFVWIEEKDIYNINIEYFDKFKNKSNKRIRNHKINQFDLNNNYLKTYNNLTEIKNDGFTKNGVIDCLKGFKNSYRGFIWKYSD